MLTIRPGRAADDHDLARLDELVWSADVTPAPPSAGSPFFAPGRPPADVLVAEVDGAVAGYTQLHQQFPVPSHEHVLELNGLAVDPARRRLGIARALLEAVAAEARSRGARKLTLRVLGPNVAAQRLYESCGFTVEGVLRGEFFLDGRDVDDVLMACRLSDPSDDRL